MKLLLSFAKDLSADTKVIKDNTKCGKKLSSSYKNEGKGIKTEKIEANEAKGVRIVGKYRHSVSL